jgi:hypothetical protein
VNRLPFEQRELHLQLGELRRGDLERAAIDDDEVGELSDLERARSLLQAVDVGRVDRIPSQESSR